MQNSELIKRCLSGSKRHQRLLYDNYYDLAFNKAYRYLNDRQEAEDAVVIAYNEVFRNLFKFRLHNEDSLKNWILTIVTNAALKILRSKIRFTVELEVIEDLAESEMETEDNSETIRQIHQIVKTMPDGYRIVFVMYVLEGYMHKEIAEFLNITVNTSKSQLSKAKTHIRTKLKVNKV